MNILTPRVVVSAILEKKEDGIRKIFLQTRWKPASSPTYSGLLEIPAGHVDGYENVFDAVRREVKEETGLTVLRFIDAYEGKTVASRAHDLSHVFQPFICQQVLETNDGLPWVGLVFRCEVEGEISMQVDEAKDPCWVSLDELEKQLKKSPETFFSLQYSTLLYYVEYMKEGKKHKQF